MKVLRKLWFKYKFWQGRNYKSVDAYQAALFERLLPKMHAMFKARSDLAKKIAEDLKGAITNANNSPTE